MIACGGGGAPIYDDRAPGGKGSTRWSTRISPRRCSRATSAPTLLLILTDVDAVYADYGNAAAAPARTLTIAEAERLDRAGAFGEGSMAPKVRAAVGFRAAHRRARYHHGACSAAAKRCAAKRDDDHIAENA